MFLTMPFNPWLLGIGFVVFVFIYWLICRASRKITKAWLDAQAELERERKEKGR